MKVNEADIERIIASVDGRSFARGVVAAPPAGTHPSANHSPRESLAEGAPAMRRNSGSRGAAQNLGLGAFETVDDAVRHAKSAFRALGEIGLEGRRRIVEAMRAASLAESERLAYEAYRETGIGRPEHKTIKNRLVSEKTPGVEDLEPVTATGDNGMTTTERAPFGVIGSITPTTNPTSTIINNAIAIIAAGNAVVFNVHPNARRVSVETVTVLNEAIVGAGGPSNLVTTVTSPTLETAKEVMHHPDIAVLLVTGGPGVVAEALRTNKKAITAGPGNPPAVVDETADLARAGRDIVYGASFDNNVICIDEKTTIVVDAAADRLIRSMESAGGRLLKGYELAKLERRLYKEAPKPGQRNKLNAGWIGRDAAHILAEAGIRAPDDTPLVLAEVPNDHPLVWSEQLMPVMPVTRVRDIDSAIDLAVRSEHGYRHTASIHSKDVARITQMARAMNCSLFIANAPNLAGLGAGGEGYTSFSIASPTGEGLTSPRTFTRARRISVVGSLHIL